LAHFGSSIDNTKGLTVKASYLPGISGLDLQHEPASGDAQIPIIFITGYGDIKRR
jgi:FixJ family two-component response regulator